MARYLVTGATGFLGSHLTSRLTSLGHEVVAFSRSREIAESTRERVVPISGDVLDREAVSKAVAGCIGAFHCAGFVSRNPQDAEELRRVHVEGSRNVLQACKHHGIVRVVVASTSGTVGVSNDPDHIATEDEVAPIALIARWPYYRAKLFAEQLALAMNGDGLEVVSVNPSLLLGPGDLRGSSTEDVRRFLEGRIPAVPAGGISFVDVRDAAWGMWLAMESGTPGSRYLVGACNLTVREFFARLERISGVGAPWLPMPRAPELARVGAEILERVAGRLGLAMPIDPISLDIAQYYWYVDSTRAETTLGWRARDPMETLSDTVSDLRRRGVVWPELEGPRGFGLARSRTESKE